MIFFQLSSRFKRTEDLEIIVCFQIVNHMLPRQQFRQIWKGYKYSGEVNKTETL